MSRQKGSDGAGYSEYTLKEVIGNAVLSDWARCVAVDSGGEVWEYSKKPALNVGGFWRGGACTKSRYITKVVPPFNFKSCIWEIELGNCYWNVQLETTRN